MGSLDLHQAIHAFAIVHQHLAEPATIASLNEEIPNWDEVISNKFILFCRNRGVFPQGFDGILEVKKQENGFHVVHIGSTYIDWAVRRHSPEQAWPGVWDETELD